MLTGKELGAAIEAARVMKRVTKKAMAEHFGVAPPSIQDWVNRGTIDKSRLPDLWDYFKDVVGASHWGLKGFSPAAGTDSLTLSALTGEGTARGGLSAKAFSLGSRLDGLLSDEYRKIAYALMANILEQYEALELAATAPRPPTKSPPPAKRSASRQSSR